jgi:hypothetical protein
MKRLVFALASVVALSISYPIAIAQGLPDMPQSNTTEKTEEEKHIERTSRVMARIGNNLRREPRIITAGPLAVSMQDLLDHKAFLSQSGTGLMRLMPRELVDNPDSAVAKEIKIRGTGASYSFFYVAHEYGYGSDIELDRDQLQTGFAGYDFGFITELGAVSLDSLTLADGRVTYLAQYTAPDNEQDARKEQLRSYQPFVLSGQEYRRTLPLKVGSTYLLRSINYRYTDTLTAFIVTRKEEDGSAIIAWKRLKVFNTPKLLTQ